MQAVETKYTPGPWTIRVATASVPTIHIHSSRGHFASVYGARHVQDARLIAAAPDLRAAVRELLEVYWGNGDGQEPEPGCIIRAKAALAAAEGRQP